MTRLVAIIMAIGVLATGCSASQAGPSVASAGPQGSTSSPSASSGKGDALAFAKCMRAHGVSDFPDPDSKGGIKANSGPGGALNPNSAVFKSAQEACKSLLPATRSGGGHAPPAGQLLKYAQCMRAHGIRNFPDPGPVGGLDLPPGGNLDPGSPLFQKADGACRQYLPGRPQTSTGGGS